MTALDIPSLGQMLRRYRVAAGLTQQEVAERAGVSVRTISDVERGVKLRCRKSTLTLLLDALDVSPPDRAMVEVANGRVAARVASPREPGMQGQWNGGLPLPPLVGRVGELALLDRHLTGEGPAVLVLAGEPGIGKSRLLHEATIRAVELGMSVLTGGCQRRAGQEPYAPLTEAFKRYLDTQPPARLRDVLRGCAWLVRLLPELAHGPIEPLPAGDVPPEQERRLLFDAARRFLSNLSSPAGTLLALDDVQWAGADAFDLLLALVRAPSLAGVSRLRVIAAYRDTDVQPGDVLSTALADLAHAGLAAHHVVPPLARAEARQLLDRLLEGRPPTDVAVRGRALDQAGGVPFFLVSCVLALDADAHGQSGEAPWSVRQSIRQRIALLPHVARVILGTAAVIGRWAPRTLLTAVVARPEDEVLDGVEAACRAHLLEEDPDGDAYLFAHDVIREVVEADLSAGRRTVLHRRIGAALEASAAGPAELPVEALAYHYSHSDDTEKALLYLQRAGDRARTQAAYASAQSYYQDLINRLEALGRTGDAAGVREKLAVTLRLASRYDDALAAVEPAAETYRALGDLDGLGRAIAEIGLLHVERGTVADGLAQIQALLASIEGSDAYQGLAVLYARLAFLLYVNGRYHEQLAAAERAVELARASGNVTILAEAEGTRGHALYMLGRLDEALEVLIETIPLAEAGDDPGILANTLIGVATAYMYHGEFERALEYTERSIAVVERLKHPAHQVVLTLRRAFIALFTGDWAAARQTIEWAVSFEEQIGETWSLAYPLLSLGALCLLEGKWDEAAQHLDRSAAIAAASNDVEALRWVHTRLAERDIMQGRPEVARDRLLPLLDRPGLEELDVTVLMPRLAWAYQELGDVARAGEVVNQAVERARRQQHRIALADALWVQGMVLTRLEAWAEAEHALEEGLTLTRVMPYPYTEARILEAYGAMHARRGEDKISQERLEEARDVFQRLGAHKDVERLNGSGLV